MTKLRVVTRLKDQRQYSLTSMNLKTNISKIAPSVGEFKLPSGGVFYGSDFPKNIKIRPYGFITEAILVTNLTSTEKMIGILKDVIEVPDGFDLTSLLIEDQSMILAIARALTYGEKYNFSSVCPSCGFSEKHSLTVPDEIPCKIWTTDPEEAKKSPSFVCTRNFTFRLPECKDTIELRYLTIADNDRAIRYGEEKKKVITAYNATFIRRLAMHIKSINGEDVGSDWEQVENDFILKLRGADMAELKKKIDDCSCGVIQQWDIACKKCSTPYKALIQLPNGFFR
jgi:hypothetical protein